MSAQKTDREILKGPQGGPVRSLEPVRLRDVYELIYSLSRTHKNNYLYSLFEVSRTEYYRYRQGKSHKADKNITGQSMKFGRSLFKISCDTVVRALENP